MYLIKPELNHEAVVLDYVSRCMRMGDALVDIFGSPALTEKFEEGGYDVWLKQVNANALSREWHSLCGLEPSNTLLLVERVSCHKDVDEEYLQQFPMISESERLVGIVTFRAVLEDSDMDCNGGALMKQVPVNGGGSAILYLSIIPCYRDTINYVLALTDSMTYAVCEGLPYKYLVYWLGDTVHRGAMVPALQSCNFDYKSTDSVTNEDIYWADLRLVHQLKGRICESTRKEE